MGEHHTNVTALYQASLPKIAPVGTQLGTQVMMRVAPAPHIVMCLADEVRTTSEGKTEVKVDENTWKELGPEQRYHELGKPLEPKDCLLVVDLVSFASSPAALVTPDQKTVTSAQALACLWSGPLSEWQSRHGLDRHPSI